MGKAAQLPLLIVQGRDDDIRPEPALILADAPSLILDASVGRGGLEVFLRLVALAPLGGVKQRAMPAEDLRLVISLNALGAGVPTDDAEWRLCDRL